MYEYIPEIMTFKECQNILRVGKNTLILSSTDKSTGKRY